MITIVICYYILKYNKVINLNDWSDVKRERRPTTHAPTLFTKRNYSMLVGS